MPKVFRVCQTNVTSGSPSSGGELPGRLKKRLSRTVRAWRLQAAGVTIVEEWLPDEAWAGIGRIRVGLWPHNGGELLGTDFARSARSSCEEVWIYGTTPAGLEAAIRAPMRAPIRAPLAPPAPLRRHSTAAGAQLARRSGVTSHGIVASRAIVACHAVGASSGIVASYGVVASHWVGAGHGVDAGHGLVWDCVRPRDGRLQWSRRLAWSRRKPCGLPMRQSRRKAWGRRMKWDRRKPWVVATHPIVACHGPSGAPPLGRSSRAADGCGTRAPRGAAHRRAAEPRRGLAQPALPKSLCRHRHLAERGADTTPRTRSSPSTTRHTRSMARPHATLQGVRIPPAHPTAHALSGNAEEKTPRPTVPDGIPSGA